MDNKAETLIKISYAKTFRRNGTTKDFRAEMAHNGLLVQKKLIDISESGLRNKVNLQIRIWENLWQQRYTKTQLQLKKDLGILSADQRTNECKDKLTAISNILAETFQRQDECKFDDFLQKMPFSIPNPIHEFEEEMQRIPKAILAELIKEPGRPKEIDFYPLFNILEKNISILQHGKLKKAYYLYNVAVAEWTSRVEDVKNANKKIELENRLNVSQYEDRIAEIRAKIERKKEEWDRQLDEYYQKQSKENDVVESFKALYDVKNADAINFFNKNMLEYFILPDEFPVEYSMDYNPENAIIIINASLPSPDDIPKISEVKYIVAKDQVKETEFSDTFLSKLYDDCIYQIVLRNLYLVFKHDRIDAIDSIVLNGWVNAVNKSTGKFSNACIVSIQASKNQVLDIDFTKVDPKSCFKNLKGVGSSKLTGLIPIQPLVQISREDRRFINSYNVVSQINEGINLAAMGWEDFEHLIRELFEKEFCSNGGEVKVTQASRDGGVDAVAFDPDPIRGGKIVIQAKRYTNTVGVSAIRDLYGTVLNEGASKGILVTTSDYGPDAYEFAKNKPITLLSGNNLLFLLEKHGHKARINLVEAKLQIKNAL